MSTSCSNLRDEVWRQVLQLDWLVRIFILIWLKFRGSVVVHSKKNTLCRQQQKNHLKVHSSPNMLKTATNNILHIYPPGPSRVLPTTNHWSGWLYQALSSSGIPAPTPEPFPSDLLAHEPQWRETFKLGLSMGATWCYQPKEAPNCGPRRSWHSEVLEGTTFFPCLAQDG